jgi:hypothetical protein
VSEPVQLTLADEYEGDGLTWHEWFVALPLDPGASPLLEQAGSADPGPVRKYPRWQPKRREAA